MANYFQVKVQFTVEDDKGKVKKINIPYKILFYEFTLFRRAASCEEQTLLQGGEDQVGKTS